MSYTHRTLRGGDPTGAIRKALENFFNDDLGEDEGKASLETIAVTDENGVEQPLGWIVDRLWNCIDIAPDDVCQSAGVDKGSTYAEVCKELAMHY